MIRITTNSSLGMYRSNLMKSTNSLNSAMTKLMTQRQFSSYASDPAAATRAFKIHSSLNATNAQYSNNDTVLHKYETAWSTLKSVLDGYDGLVQDTGRVPALSGLNDTNLSTLNTQGQIIREGAEAIIQAMNGKYGNNFVFAGADSLNAPLLSTIRALSPTAASRSTIRIPWTKFTWTIRDSQLRTQTVRT